MTTYSAQSIVFIDSRVPDLQDLIDGVQQGDLVYVLDPNSDGVQQIADILAANNLTDLSSISIVGHGESGEMELGSSFINDSNLSSHSNALAEIGASLAPGGTIQLYGCDVAMGTAGQQFVNDFSTLAGGAPVAASTHLVGSADLGGSWTLDASSTNGASAPSSLTAAPTTNGAVQTPFTQAALGNFQGELAVTPDAQIWMVTAGGGKEDTVDHVNNNAGSNTAGTVTTLYSQNAPPFVHPKDIVLDTNDGKWFMVDSTEGNNRILEGSLFDTATTPTLTTIYSDTLTFGSNISAIAIDPVNHQLYFTENVVRNSTAFGTGYFERINFTPTGTTGTGLVTLATVADNSGTSGTPAFSAGFEDFALDLAHNAAYFTSSTSQFGTTTTSTTRNFLYKATGVTSVASSVTMSILPIAGSGGSNQVSDTTVGILEGIAVNSATQTLYFTADPFSTLGHGGVYSYAVTGNTAGNIGTVWQQSTPHQIVFNTLTTTPYADLFAIDLDAATGVYYLGDAGQFNTFNSLGQKTHSGPEDGRIYIGNLAGGAPTAFTTITVNNPGPTTLPANGMAIDNAPSLAITALTPTFTESSSNPASSHNTPVLLLSGDSASDSDNVSLAFATVQIGSFFAGDTLSFTPNHNITGSYNSTSGALVLSGIDSFTDYQTALQSVTFTSTSDNPTDYGSDNSRTLTWVVNDGLLTSPPQTSTVSVVGVNDPPTLSSVATTAQYTEEGAAGVLSSALSVIDVDDLNLSSATIQITGGTFAGDHDVLAATTTSTNITAVYNSSTETLTLTGTDTLAHYQTVLRSVNFSAGENPTDFGSNQTRTITWLAKDPGGTALGGQDTSSGTSITTLTITNVNDPPVLTGVSPSVSFTEGQQPTLTAPVSITDADDLNLVGATLVIGGGFSGDGDTLTASGLAGTHITQSYNSSTETLTLSGSDTLANYQTVLDNISFSSGQNPDDYGSKTSRTITWQLNDGSGTANGGVQLSTPVTQTVGITAINDPPVLSNVAPTASYTENAVPQTLSSALTVSDVDSLNLHDATVSIAGGFAGDGDVLATSTAGTSITASYNSSTETLTLTGSDTLLHYQQVLDKVTFNSTSDNPDDYGSNPTRTITWIANDGSGSNNLSSVQTTTLSITAVNDPPTVTGQATSVSFTENSAAVTLSPSLTASDPDSLTLASATVKISGSFAGDGDVLGFATAGTSITASYDSTTETLTLTGADTPADYQSVLDSVTFTTASHNPTNFGSNPTRTITWVLNDGAASNSQSTAQTTTLSITAINDPPTLSNVAPSAQFTEGNGAVVLSSVAAVSDPDNQNLANATVSIGGQTFSGDGDVLSFSTSGTSITANYNAGTETLTLTGSDTLAHYQSVLDTIAFSSTSDNPDQYGSNPTRTVTWVLNDGSGSNNLSAVQTETVTITAVNDPPSLSNVAPSAQFTEGNGAVVLSNAVSVADPDSLDLASATVAITTGTFAGDGDVLAVSTAGTTITANYDSSSETLTLTGADTLAHYQQVLDTLTFNSTSPNPDDYGSKTTRSVTWVLNDGAGSNNLSTSQTENVTITAVDNAPTLSGVPANDSFVVGTTLTLAPSASVSDPDSLDLTNATVAITAGKFTNDDDVLGFDTTGTSITANYDAGTETLTLTGSDTLADYQKVLDSVTFSSTAADPTNAGSNPTRTISWTVNDGTLLSSVQTTTVTIQNGPALNPPAHAAFTENQGSPATLAPSLVVSDSTLGALITSATVKIAGGTFGGDGDVLAADTSGTVITASYDTGSETLTLTGADTLAHYQAVLDTVSFTTPSDNPTDFGADPTRTVSWTITDDQPSNNTGAATSTIDITAINDAPTLALGTTVASWTEDPGTPTTLAPAATVSDPDNVNLASATVQITGGTFAGDADFLAADVGGTNITESYDSSTETLLLTGTDSLGNYQTVLNSITFHAGENPTDYGSDPTRTLTWVLNDGSGSFATSAATVSTIDITNVNDPPTLSNVAATAAFELNQTITLSPTTSVSDPDNLSLVGATVSITDAGISNGTFNADGSLTGDVLGFDTSGTNITANYDSSTETLTLTGSDTLADYQTVLDRVTFSSGANPSDSGSDTTRTVTWVVDDGSGSNNTSTPQTTTISVHVGPAIFVPASASYTEQQPGGATIAPSVSINDTNATTTLTSATVAITGGTFSGDGDVLELNGAQSGNFGTGASTISFAYNSSTETLTLTGPDSFSDFEQLLETLTFSTPSDNPDEYGSDPTRTLTWTVDDGTNTGTTTSTINITAVNDPPVLADTTTSAQFTENAGPITLSNTFSVSDPDNLDLASAAVVVGTGTFAGDGDVLAADTSGTSITASYNSSTETLTLTGPDTLAHYQQVLDKVTFNSTSDNPDDFGSSTTRQVGWVLNDGAGSNNLSFEQTTTVTITALNDPPTLSNQTGSDSFTVGTTITVSPTISVSDPDSQALTSATVAIAGGFSGDGDVLTADTSSTNITASYDATSETLTLTGSDTLAHYQTVLDSVTFSSGNNPNHSNSAPTRTVTWTVDDGSATSHASSGVLTTINIAHEPPILTSVAPTLDFTQGQTLAVSPSITVTDFDSTTLVSGIVQIAGGFTSDGDVLSFSTTGTSITASYNASTETLTLTGSDTLGDYQSVLDSVKFSSGSTPTNHGSNPTRTVTWVVNDGNASLGQSTAETTTIDITLLEAAPTLSNVAPSAHFTENGASVVLSSTLAVSDPDSANMSSATVSIKGGTFSGDGDVLSFSTAGTSITASYNSTSEVLTLTGPDTKADYQLVLDSVAFSTPSDNPTEYGSDPTRTITWVVEDDQGKPSAVQTTTVSITAINDPPALSAVTPTVSFLEGTTIQLSPTLSVSDPDNLQLANATVSIGGGFAGSGDLLTANVAGTHITQSYSSSTETLTLTGSDPLATYQAVLESIKFSSGFNPTDYGSNPTRTLTWVVNDGSGSNNLSTAQTETISITAINDPPALSGITNATYTEEQGAPTTLSGSASVADPDNLDLANATVAIGGGTFAGDHDLLTFSTTGTSITASYDSTSEVLTLSGSDTLSNYQKVLDSVAFSAGENPTNYGSDAFRTITWLLNDGSLSNNLSTVQTTTVSITNVNDPPTLANVPATVTYTEEGTLPVTLSSTILVTDADSLTFAGATVAITGGTFAVDGDVLTADTTGTNITANYDSVTEVLTLSGTDTPANYTHVLESVTFVTRAENPNNFGSNPTRTITWTVDDGGTSNNISTGATTVSITNVNDAPTLSNVTPTASFTEEGGAVILSSAVTVTDADNINLTNATVQITGGTFTNDHDQLAATAIGNITVNYSSSTEALTLSGTDTLAHYQSVLDTVTFNAGENPTDFGSNPTRTLVWTLNDGSGSFNLSPAVTSTISITNINDAPTLGCVAPSANFTEEGGAVTLASGASVGDLDDVNLSSATVKITGGGFTGDVLAANTAGTAITASYNAASETLTLSGADTLAHYQQVLDSVTFNAGENPTDFGSNPTRTLTWTLTDPSGTANGGVNVSAPVTSTISVTSVNDPPTLSNVASLAQVLFQGQTITLSPAASVSDPDNLTLANATVKITGCTFAGDGDVLAATTSGTSITASYNASTETLMLAGSDTLAHYSQVLDSITYDSTSANPTNAGSNLTRTVTWTLNDGSGSNNLSTPATTTISFQSPVKNDFNGDRKSDLLLQNVAFSGNPNVMIDFLNGTSIASSNTISTPNGWHVEAAADFNHDNKSDIILQNNDGLPEIWLMNGGTVTSTVTLPNPGASWHVIAAADFNNDGNPDILWQNNDGQPIVWLMNGTTPVGGGPAPFNPGATWRAIGAGDFNGDGKADILWQNADGQPDIWFMNGTNVIGGGAPLNPGMSWHAIGVGDFNGDGKADILWQNADGQPDIWFMNGANVIGGGALPFNPGASWHAIGTSDFNGDGLADIVWQNADGTPDIWLMNGTSVIGGGSIANPGATWQVKADGPISPDEMGSGTQTTPTLHLSLPDTTNAAPHLSAPDGANALAGSQPMPGTGFSLSPPSGTWPALVGAGSNLSLLDQSTDQSYLRQIVGKG